MARPYKHPRTGVYYFRQRVPTDLRPLLGDKIVSRSLHTKDPETAKALNAAAVQKQAMVWERLRKRPKPLPHSQIMALAGISYREIMAMMELEPGEPAVWEAAIGLLDRLAAAPDRRVAWYESTVDQMLLEHGIVTDDYSRTRLIKELDSAFRQAAEQQLKRAQGDYSADPKGDRFPALAETPKIETDGVARGVSIRALFVLWERDHLANGKSLKTVTDFRQKIESLITFLGHDEANRVTAENVAEWCDHLRHSDGLAARTVSQKYLAVVKLVFGLAVEKRKIKTNPTIGAKVRFTKPQLTRPKGYTDKEALRLLQAALVDPESLGRRSDENKRAIRWGAWICAFSGARISEVMQLRTQDLFFETIDGQTVPCLRITPEAGSVKTGKFRIVPVHPQLQEMGLVELFQSLAPGPIFYGTDFRRQAADPVKRAQNAGAKVAEWARNVVLITDPRVQPNHAWRHRFKTVARDVDIAPEYMDAIQGHEDGRSASDYGETTMKALWREVRKLPRYNIAGQR